MAGTEYSDIQVGANDVLKKPLIDTVRGAACFEAFTMIDERHALSARRSSS